MWSSCWNEERRERKKEGVEINYCFENCSCVQYFHGYSPGVAQCCVNAGTFFYFFFFKRIDWLNQDKGLRALMCLWITWEGEGSNSVWHSALLSPWSVCSYVLLHVALIPPPTHTRRLLSLFIYTLWMCAEPLSLFLSQLSYRSEDFHRPALRAGGRPVLLQESAQDLTQSTSLDVPSKKPLRLHFVSGFPPTDPYHSYSLIISFRLFPHLYFFFFTLDLSSMLLAALWIEFFFICFVSNQLSSTLLLRLVIVTTDRSCSLSPSLGGSNIVSGWCLALCVNI